MFSFLQTRGDARALVGAVLVAGSLGGVLCGALIADGQAHGAGAADHGKGLANAAAAGFANAALRQSASTPSPTINPNGVNRVALRPALPAAVSVSGPAARPFRTAGALDASHDLDCLTQAVYYEAGSDTAAGQAAVAQVVLNRVRHPTFPKTICGVVYQGAASGHCQFSFICDGAMQRTRAPAMWESSRRVAVKALGGYVMAEAGEAVSFHAAYLGRLWSGLQPVGRIGAHLFYRFGPHGAAGFQNGVYAVDHQPDAPAAADRPLFADASPAPDSGAAHLATVTTTRDAASAGQPAVAVVPVTTSKAPAEPAPKPAPAPAPTAAGAS